jgi:hypothetical protein
LIAEVYERIEARFCSHEHVASSPSISSIRSAIGDKFLAPKADCAAPTMARSDVQLHFIDKFHERAEIKLTADLNAFFVTPKVLKFYSAIDEREESKVATHTDI